MSRPALSQILTPAAFHWSLPNQHFNFEMAPKGLFSAFFGDFGRRLQVAFRLLIQYCESQSVLVAVDCRPRTGDL